MGDRIDLKRAFASLLLGVGLGGIAPPATEAAKAKPLFRPDFVLAAEQGYGDRQNGQTWAMTWWNDQLYVGTGRATACVQQATLIPFGGSYPPSDPDLDCAPDPRDLPLQAEILRYTPSTDTWELVFTSPNDVEIPGSPGRFTARDIGFRGMLVFREPDGTEALYVAGVSSRSIFGPAVPPPRILRSTDGVVFEPLPQDPGTFLGDTPAFGFRTLRRYEDRLFATASEGLLGHGAVIEASDPAGGNDHFRQVTPARPFIFEMEPYNGFLYLGTGGQPANQDPPFSVLKTDATGTPPYELTTVIPEAAHRRFLKNSAVISMVEFKNRLYVGTDQELLRINPDDSWDLLVGSPRPSPLGRLEPLSGMDIGFDNFLNIHMWRMVAHDGRLYIGTQDLTTRLRTVPLLGPLLAPHQGFDLFSTSDGWHFTEVSRDGFGGPFDIGVRNYASTPKGLFLATANQFFGTNLYRGVQEKPVVPAPERLEAERGQGGFGGVVLTWTGPAKGVRYHIRRARGVGILEEIDIVELSDTLAEALPRVLGFSLDPEFIRTTLTALQPLLTLPTTPEPIASIQPVALKLDEVARVTDARTARTVRRDRQVSRRRDPRAERGRKGGKDDDSKDDDSKDDDSKDDDSKDDDSKDDDSKDDDSSDDDSSDDDSSDDDSSDDDSSDDDSSDDDSSDDDSGGGGQKVHVFVDANTSPLAFYHYTIQAENSKGQLSGPSNLVLIPSRTPHVRFGGVIDRVQQWDAPRRVVRKLRRARLAFQLHDYDRALKILRELQKEMGKKDRDSASDDDSGKRKSSKKVNFRAPDIEVLLEKLERRVLLVQMGLQFPLSVL